jgi:acetoin utilization deacetylase AcuC-like enzyme
VGASRLVVSGCDVDADGHDTGPHHPERPSRLVAVREGIRDAGFGDVDPLPRRLATRDELLRVHSAAYLDALERFCAAGGGALDPDTIVSRGTWDTALAAAGAGLAAIDALAGGSGDAAFVGSRPPGHHADRTRAMGFCVINNIAVAAAALAAAGEHVLIVDWDVHHGNGTQDIFWDDPTVAYFSTHQSPLYPGTGRMAETGGPNARGYTVNVPLPAGATGDALRRAFEEIARPLVAWFEPGWVLVSAGFDAHRDDPLAELELTSGDFADLAELVADLAPRAGRVALFLEGGYHRPALRMSAAAAASAVVGGDHRPEPRSSGGPGAGAVDAVRDLHTRLLEERT